VTDWITQSKRAAQITGGGKPATSAKPAGPGKASTPSAKADADNAPKKKLSYKDQRELEGLPAQIQQLESQQKAIEQELYDGTLYTRDAKRAAELNARNSKIEEELMDALHRWETLSA
jgi:ATP-binding cassette subfamily F protein uup